MYKALIHMVIDVEPSTRWYDNDMSGANSTYDVWKKFHDNCEYHLLPQAVLCSEYY